MAQLSDEARIRLTDAEKALAERWGRVAAKLMVGYSSALFIEGVACPEHAVQVLMQIIENLYGTIVAKIHPTKREEITADIDDFLVKLFSEHYPGQTFVARRDAQGGDLTIDVSGDALEGESAPPDTLH